MNGDIRGCSLGGTIAIFERSSVRPRVARIFQVRGHTPIPAPISVKAPADSYTST